MLFNSIEYAFFLPIVFILYWFVFHRNLRLQNLLLFIASYFFYACWDWRFMFLLLFSTLLDFITGIQVEKATKMFIRKFWFWLSICINLGFLGVFKYYNFFADSLGDIADKLGVNFSPVLIHIILPVGISFYTFHGLSYIIDIYKGKIRAEKNFIDYAVFVSFFPLLVAGPIERATHLLPQIKTKRYFSFDSSLDGLKQILWGLFKKIVIADNCAVLANHIFNNSSELDGSTLVLGALFFTFQIYGDFSGYSDIALGTARLFGINLLRNFAFPYFSRDIAEFWRRWHISLSSWFKDYLYIPLGGSKGGNWMRIRNTFIIFIVSGFWHGANWTFIIWGVLNALFIMPSIIFRTNRKNLEVVALGRFFPSFKDVIPIFITFSLTVFAWIFFRANNLNHAFSYISTIFSSTILNKPTFPDMGFALTTSILIIIFMLLEWNGRHNEFAIAKLGSKWSKPVRWAFYYMVIFAIIWYGGSQQEFIYFQF